MADQQLTAIVTTHNHIDKTRRCVHALQEHTPGVRIILADDRSTDGTREWAQELGVKFVACSHPGNLARNRQDVFNDISMLGDPYIAWLDNDVYVTPGWWERLYQVFQQEPRVGILAPAKDYPTGQVQNTGRRLRYNGVSFGVALERPIVWPDYVDGACMVCRPQVALECIWNEELPFWYNDVDYCFQARSIGWETAVTNRARVIHDAHTTSPKMDDGEINRCRAIFLKKWKDEL